MTENRYLRWLSSETASVYWHDSAIVGELDEAMANGAVGMTTNAGRVCRRGVRRPVLRDHAEHPRNAQRGGDGIGWLSAGQTGQGRQGAFRRRIRFLPGHADLRYDHDGGDPVPVQNRPEVRQVGDILLVVVLYSLVSGTLKTVRSTREQLAGTPK